MARTTQVEVESKFDVDESFRLPDLLALPSVATVELPVEQTLEATYFDTADLRLLKSKITLRRRTGGQDAGWHLKLPTTQGARLEVREPLGTATRTVPPRLSSLVRVRVRSEALVPVARLTTRRIVHRLLGAEGVVLAEVSDDTVVATTLATEPGEKITTMSFREVEVELVEGTDGLLRAADPVLRAAGARPAATSSKLAKVLQAKAAALEARTRVDDPSGTGVADVAGAADGAAAGSDSTVEAIAAAAAAEGASGDGPAAHDGDRGTESTKDAKKVKAADSQQDGKGDGRNDGKSGRSAGRAKGKKKSKASSGPTAGEVAMRYVAQQVEELQAWDPHVRVDREDAVHKMRVSTRRLRSALATDRPLIDRTVTDPLREELRWLGTVLGGARDAEVLHARLRGEVERLPAELVVGPVLARIDSELTKRYRDAHDAVLVELDGERYLSLVEALDQLVADPPLTGRASLPADKEIVRVVRRTRRRVERTVEALWGARTSQERDHLLHEVRKAAKRARYAGESVTDFFGTPASDYAETMEGFQEILGTHQDSVVAREELRAMGMRAHLAGENGFTFGLLYGKQMAYAEDDERSFRKAWSDAATHLRWP